ncbi:MULTISPECIES: Uma2 family endonuclease [unclassified Nodularia (in: cyanobacteria)]|uniref:Uma2 family endonuclease n=1 Tax=unclassified Nodularia (in: cyanobacteria) TaxID=2656917 RepID=UPI00188191A4|nr:MULTISPECIES: Uma2 family endonuclease [unclassified Nodularia (in: cyanobacteria)]MBE9199387.1 Uma2 family endonuclease [Nodularia sp. LEGE 06071]MCC2692884.1 Uma2 family endonuclease [Nodularia sp. LEGE 04288]
MTAVSPVLKPVSQLRLAPGSTVTIQDVSWEEFESILRELGEKRSARIAYSQSTLEIMVPLPEHEKPKDLISDIVKILLKKTGRKYEPFGSTTFKRENIAGVEPDACFYIQNYQSMISRRRLEPDEPPPDLAIEMDVTSKTTLDAYEAIAVPELWIYDSSKLTIYLLQNGNYLKSDLSPTFPHIPLTQIIPATVERAWQVGTVQALEEFAEQVDSSIL